MFNKCKNIKKEDAYKSKKKGNVRCKMYFCKERQKKKEWENVEQGGAKMLINPAKKWRVEPHIFFWLINGKIKFFSKCKAVNVAQK